MKKKFLITLLVVLITVSCLLFFACGNATATISDISGVSATAKAN